MSRSPSYYTRKKLATAAKRTMKSPVALFDMRETGDWIVGSKVVSPKNARAISVLLHNKCPVIGTYVAGPNMRQEDVFELMVEDCAHVGLLPNFPPRPKPHHGDDWVKPPPGYTPNFEDLLSGRVLASQYVSLHQSCPLCNAELP